MTLLQHIRPGKRGCVAGRPAGRLVVLGALALGFAAVCLAPQSSSACAACYGQSDSPMAYGLNWGILSLLVVVVGVLGGIATFFVLMARRASAASSAHKAAASPAPNLAEPSPVTAQ